MVWKTLLGKGIQVPQKDIKNSRSLLSIANILSEMNYTHSTTGREFALMQFELIVMLLKIYNYTRNLQTVPKGCFWFFPWQWVRVIFCVVLVICQCYITCTCMVTVLCGAHYEYGRALMVTWLSQSSSIPTTEIDSTCFILVKLVIDIKHCFMGEEIVVCSEILLIQAHLFVCLLC